MSEINLDLTVTNTELTFVVDSNEIVFTSEPIQLNLLNGSSPVANGANYSVQYNIDGTITGSSEFLYLSPFQRLRTPNLSVTGTAIFSNVANVYIPGGTNGYVLQTDGLGNLGWTAQTGGSGNGSPGGSNTQIQYNDAGSFGGNAGFTFNEITGNVSIPGNLSVTGSITANIASANYANFAGTAFNVSASNITGQVANALVSGTVYSNNQANITSVGTLTTLAVAGTTSIQQAQEKVTANGTGATGTINFDLLDQAIILQTANASANFTLNFRGNSSTTLNSIMSSNQSMTCTYINKNGTTGYLPTTFSVDGNVVTPLWTVPSAPSGGTVNGYDMFTFNIIKTAGNTFAVFAAGLGYI